MPLKQIECETKERLYIAVYEASSSGRHAEMMAAFQAARQHSETCVTCNPTVLVRELWPGVEVAG